MMQKSAERKANQNRNINQKNGHAENRNSPKPTSHRIQSNQAAHTPRETLDTKANLPSKEELEVVNIINLAVMCQKIADNPSIDKETATSAGKMKWEWAQLVSRETAPSFAEHEQIQAEKRHSRSEWLNC